MAGDSKKLVQQQFGANAAKYVTSPVHATGGSLPRLLALTDPQSGWRVLDIATGGGHTALAFSPHSKVVVASDLTFKMLVAARRFATDSQAGNIDFCQHDAERLPFPYYTFDLVACRIAPHHFSDVAAFVREAARVLKPGGLLAIADNVTSGEPRIARFVNMFEQLRDPSHNWAYSEADWVTFLTSAGLIIRHTETIEKRIEFDRWAARMSVTGVDLLRLQALLEQSPAAPRTWLKIESSSSQLAFWLQEAIFVAHKP